MSAIRHSTLYNEIAGVMTTFNVHVSSKQCKSQMTELKDEFRKAFDKNKGTGAGAPTFEHFDTMMKIFHGSATLVTPYSTSVGRGLVYSVNGVSKDTTSHSGTRTRPCPISSKRSEKGSGKMKRTIFKSWNQEIAERQLQLKEQENEQLRLMRVGFEKKSEERSSMIKDLVTLAAWDMQMRLGLNPKEGSGSDLLSMFKSVHK